jgi:hypothetical protein
MIFSFSPAIASLITRAVTKEGFRDMKLHLNLSGNFKWYLLAFGLPLICFSAKFLLPVIISGHSDWLSGFTVPKNKSKEINLNNEPRITFD